MFRAPPTTARYHIPITHRTLVTQQIQKQSQPQPQIVQQTVHSQTIQPTQQTVTQQIVNVTGNQDAIVIGTKPNITNKRGRGSRINNSRPPPGAVNLERSYEICRAVIQNSPNRHQLKAQLRPPPSLLAKNVQVTNSTITSGGTVTKIVKKIPDEQTISTSNRIMLKVSFVFNHWNSMFSVRFGQHFL